MGFHTRLMTGYGMHVRFTYIVSRSPADADTVFVTEAWTTREAHDRSLEDDDVRALIARAMPLMAAPPDAVTLAPAGGKGL